MFGSSATQRKIDAPIDQGFEQGVQPSAVQSLLEVEFPDLSDGDITSMLQTSIEKRRQQEQEQLIVAEVLILFGTEIFTGKTLAFPLDRAIRARAAEGSEFATALLGGSAALAWPARPTPIPALRKDGGKSSTSPAARAAFSRFASRHATPRNFVGLRSGASPHIQLWLPQSWTGSAPLQSRALHPSSRTEADMDRRPFSLTSSRLMPSIAIGQFVRHCMGELPWRPSQVAHAAAQARPPDPS